MGVTAHKESGVRLWGLELIFFPTGGVLSKHSKPKIKHTVMNPIICLVGVSPDNLRFWKLQFIYIV